QTWGRDDSLAELWTLIAQAMSLPATCSASQTPGKDCRNADQQNAVAWLTAVYQRDAVRAAQDAGLEYVKWAGLNQGTYNTDLTNYLHDLNVDHSSSQAKTTQDHDTLQNFLTRGFSPGPFNFNAPVSTCPTSGGPCVNYNGTNYTEGYCVFQPPQPYGSSDYSDVSNPTCSGPCPVAVAGGTCIPLGPTYDQLVKLGAADVQNQLFNTPQAVQEVNNVAIGVGFAVGTAAAITALSLSVALVPSAISWSAAAAGLVPLEVGLFPFSTAASVIASVGGLL